MARIYDMKHERYGTRQYDYKPRKFGATWIGNLNRQQRKYTNRNHVKQYISVVGIAY